MIAQLQWEAKKAAYRVFRLIPRECTKDQKRNMELSIFYVYQRFGIPTEANQPYYAGNVIKGAW